MDTLGWVILILILTTIALWVYAITDIVSGAVRGSRAKMFWLVVVLLFPIIGVILYYLYGKRRRADTRRP